MFRSLGFTRGFTDVQSVACFGAPVADLVGAAATRVCVAVLVTVLVVVFGIVSASDSRRLCDIDVCMSSVDVGRTIANRIIVGAIHLAKIGLFSILDFVAVHVALIASAARHLHLGLVSTNDVPIDVLRAYVCRFASGKECVREDLNQVGSGWRCVGTSRRGGILEIIDADEQALPVVLIFLLELMIAVHPAG